MNRRDLLSTAAGSIGLLAGGAGVVGAGRPAAGDVVVADLRVLGRDEPADPKIDVTCTDRRVEVDGVIVGSDSCATAALQDVRFEDGTLTVVVEERRAKGTEDRVCLQVLVGIDYVANVVLDEAPETVRVVHDGPEGATATHQCGGISPDDAG